MANVLNTDKQIAVIGALAAVKSAEDAVRAFIVQESRIGTAEES